jgi:hypothetical protein
VSATGCCGMPPPLCCELRIEQGLSQGRQTLAGIKACRLRGTGTATLWPSETTEGYDAIAADTLLLALDGN